MKKSHYFYRRDLKILLLVLFVTLTIGIASAQQNTVNTQRKQVFEKEMNAYIATQIDKEIAEIKKNANLIENFDEYTEEDMRNMAKENAKDKYIRHNMKEYLNTYFSDPQAIVTTDTFICDNGGFEDGFLYYKGYTATFEEGSLTCTPVDGNGNDIVYTLATLPTPRRFEIVTSGIDDLGLLKTKFGNKALKINNKLGHHETNNCTSKSRGVDKIVKRFKVTDKNRDFTIWYSVALENPSAHGDQQPFLNIKCDLAPDNELCFDASIIKCPQHFNDPCVFDSVDILGWSCHRFKIPKDNIGEIATLEITVGDCGLGAHFGYAYIDGICEECDSSALGSAFLDEEINYRSCDGEIATICGTYTAPTICSNGGTWAPVEITVPGYDISGVVIDTASKSFCFNFPITNFTDEECLEIYAELTFNNGVFDLPEVLTNTIEICQGKFTHYVVDITIGECNPDNLDGNLSNDYYYVTVDLTNIGDSDWTIEKQLINPYPNESGLQTLATGTGDTTLEFGPFYIQDGDWWLNIDFPNCVYEEYIETPDYCSGCDKFNEVEISNIECILDEQTGEYNWTFEMVVPCDGSSWSYSISGGGEGGTHSCGENVFFKPGSISNGCVDITLIATSCSQPINITVCPPKPCPKEGNCDLEVSISSMECIVYKGVEYFFVGLDISDPPPGKYVCTSPGYIYPYVVGPLLGDAQIKVSLCDNPGCTLNCDCYKWVYAPKPNCNVPLPIINDPRFGVENKEAIVDLDDIRVMPNPVISNEIIIRSSMHVTDFEIYDSTGKLINKSKFIGSDYRLTLDIVPGLYFVRYINSQGKSAFVKMIKL